jgi:hypothetical protein
VNEPGHPRDPDINGDKGNGIPQSHSFARGAELGGAVVYEEPPRSVNVRRAGCTLAMLSMTALALFVTIFVAILNLSNGYPHIITELVGLTVVIDVYGAILVIIAFRDRRSISPFRVYEAGVSIGKGKEPFLPFSDIEDVHAEERDHYGRPFIRIVFKGGGDRIVRADFAIDMKEYGAMKEALAGGFDGWQAHLQVK